MVHAVGMDNVLTIAASGIRNAEQAFTQAAADTLSAALPEPPSAPPAITMPQRDLADGVVAQLQARTAFRANLAIYRTANDLYRALLKATDEPR
jgi:hypothetical protein